jgi:hypothetical protein
MVLARPGSDQRRGRGGARPCALTSDAARAGECPPRQGRLAARPPRAVSWPGRIPRPEVSAMSNHVYKHLELTGSSPDGIEAAIRNAIAKANETVRNIQWFEVVETRGHVKDGAVAHWQVTLKLGFTLE